MFKKYMENEINSFSFKHRTSVTIKVIVSDMIQDMLYITIFYCLKRGARRALADKAQTFLKKEINKNLINLLPRLVETRKAKIMEGEMQHYVPT